MPSLIDIRRRVRSVRNTQQITKAMKMISAAKLRKAQERALASRPYAAMLDQILSNVAEAAAQNSDSVHPLLAVRPEKNILAIVVTADKGLAGGFNSNLLKLSQRFVNEHQGEHISLELIGRKARDYYRRRTLPIHGEHLDLFRQVKFEDAERIAVHGDRPAFPKPSDLKIRCTCSSTNLRASSSRLTRSACPDSAG